jgi:Carbohydrate esterase, sialic acid-specific acetylesterase/Secretion system C-terminal sorting domain
MTKFKIIIFLLFICSSLKAQKFSSTTFDKLPQNYQLYPRNEQNEAFVPISGKIEESGYIYFSVQIFRNKQLFGYQRSSIFYQNSIGKFSFNSIKISAERADYDFKVFGVRGRDSVNIVNRENVVAGDVYVLTGQSNSTGFFRESKTDEYCRTFGKITGTYNTENYNPADTLWALSNQDAYSQGVGTMGFEFQKYILDRYGIPTCLVNAGFHWSTMAQHALRTSNNPTDLSNGYGRMIYRLEKSGLKQSVKALIFRQGETEGYGEGNNWGGYFDIFYKNIKNDFPSIKQFYVFQIDVIGFTLLPNQAPVRETQRSLVDKYPDVQVLASVGTVGFDGIHYHPDGYKQNGEEVGRLAVRDFYNSTDRDNINAPNLRKAYFSSKSKNEITLMFDSEQNLSWTESYKNLLMKNQFYLNGVNQVVKFGVSNANKIILKLNNSIINSTISYLPSFIESQNVEDQYRGPYITNSRGLRALSFHEIRVENYSTPALEKPDLSAKLKIGKAVELSWDEIVGANSYVLEMRNLQNDSYSVLKTLSKGNTSFTVENLDYNTNYTFRIKTVSDKLESDYSFAQILTAKVMAAPQLKAEATYFDALKLTWNAVPESVAYIIEAKNLNNNTFELLAKVDNNTFEYQVKSLKDNTLYTYRIKSVGIFSESVYTNAEIKTIALLANPELNVMPLYYNSLKVSWKTILNAKSYILEKKEVGQDYKKINTFDSNTLTFIDKDLQANSTYSYRLKAFGDKTESVAISIDGQTPVLLATPELVTVSTEYNQIKISWKPVQNATQYVLENKLPETDVYKELIKIDGSKTEYIDSGLKEKTTYFYRLKAFGDKTESQYVISNAQTVAILKTEEEILNGFSFFPNPAHSQITLRFSKPMTGQISLTDIRGVEIFQKEIIKKTESIISLNNYQSGVYLLNFKNEDGVISRKLVID